jgi:imidazole glycerol phosphate synthase glutamine amidotransferase subunit
MIQIINTGVANIRSLQAAFDRMGQAWNLTENIDDIVSASHVVLPGVGAYAAAAEAIDRLGLRDTVADRLRNHDVSTLCICLGMQLLGTSSQESPGVAGLGVIDKTITRFGADVQVPQLGWNNVVPHPSNDQAMVEAGEAYFANSFCLKDPPQGWNYATTDYDGAFVSCLWQGKTLACQFHPELSGKWGQQLLQRWIG